MLMREVMMVVAAGDEVEVDEERERPRVVVQEFGDVAGRVPVRKFSISSITTAFLGGYAETAVPHSVDIRRAVSIRYYDQYIAFLLLSGFYINFLSHLSSEGERQASFGVCDRGDNSPHAIGWLNRAELVCVFTHASTSRRIEHLRQIHRAMTSGSNSSQTFNRDIPLLLRPCVV